VSWQIVYTKHAQKEVGKLASAGLKENTKSLLAILSENPFQNLPAYKKLIGDLVGAYSRRINIQHRLAYQVLKKQRGVKVLGDVVGLCVIPHTN
jgi:toxin YoeB